MQLFKLKTRLSRFDDFAGFAETFQLGERDLVITNGFLYTPFMEKLGLPCRFVMQEKYGAGEPSDEMMNAILDDVRGTAYDRVVAVGGGTVIDIAKLFVLKGLSNVTDAFERKIPLEKEKALVIVPTTCGTGSEVTNISIAEIRSKQTKMGLADDTLLADDAVFIPELLRGLPYQFYLYSAIDALIHACESFVSPRANPYTRIYSREAIRTILDIFSGLAEQGSDYRFGRLEEMLLASNYAGIAFANAGVGAVHALSYPLGGTYHVPHGEANYQFFTAVFRYYQAQHPDGAIAELNRFIGEVLHTEGDPYEALDRLLGKLIPRKRLQEYGMTAEDIDGFTDSVVRTQQRLLANNYTDISLYEIKGIYIALY